MNFIFPSTNFQEMQIEVNQVFKFDRVFGSQTSQQAVFAEISHLVQSSLDGYNSCIYAYGQTGLLHQKNTLSFFRKHNF